MIDSELLAHVYLAMTGGQTALSLDPEAGESRRGDATGDAGMDPAHGGHQQADAPQHEGLIVLRADDDEAAAHEAMLNKLRDAGNCVWDQN